MSIQVEKTVQKTVLPKAEQKDLPQANQPPVRPEEQTALPPLPAGSCFGFIGDLIGQLVELISNLLFTKIQPAPDRYAIFCDAVKRPLLTHREFYTAWKALSEDLDIQNKILKYHTMISHLKDSDDQAIPGYIREEKQRIGSTKGRTDVF